MSKMAPSSTDRHNDLDGHDRVTLIADKWLLNTHGQDIVGVGVIRNTIKY